MGAPPPPIRVSVDAASGVLGDVVTRTIRSAPGIELVDPPTRASTTDAGVADVVILAGTDPDTVTWPTPELGCGSTRLLAISDDGHRSCLFELLPRRETLGELTPETLIAAVRRPLPRVLAARQPATDKHPHHRQLRASPLAPRRPNAHEED
jgi:hypothetical protein